MNKKTKEEKEIEDKEKKRDKERNDWGKIF